MHAFLVISMVPMVSMMPVVIAMLVVVRGWLGLKEKGASNDGHQVANAQERARHQDEHEQAVAAIGCSKRQVPLAP